MPPPNWPWIHWHRREMCSLTPMLQGSGMQPRMLLSPNRSSKQRGFPPCSCSGCLPGSGSLPHSGCPLPSGCPPGYGSPMHSGCPLHSDCLPGSGSPMRSGSQTRSACPRYPRCPGSPLHRSASDPSSPLHQTGSPALCWRSQPASGRSSPRRSRSVSGQQSPLCRSPASGQSSPLRRSPASCRLSRSAPGRSSPLRRSQSAPGRSYPLRQSRYCCSRQRRPSALCRTIPYSHRTTNSPWTLPPAPPGQACWQYRTAPVQPLPPLFPRR